MPATSAVKPKLWVKLMMIASPREGADHQVQIGQEGSNEGRAEKRPVFADALSILSTDVHRQPP